MKHETTERKSERELTVTFEETGGKTRVVVHDLYPSKAALDAIASESTGGFTEARRISCRPGRPGGVVV